MQEIADAFAPNAAEPDQLMAGFALAVQPIGGTSAQNAESLSLPMNRNTAVTNVAGNQRILSIHQSSAQNAATVSMNGIRPKRS